MNDLEAITGFRAEKTDSSSNTCSTALVIALLNLTGHVKQVDFYWIFSVLSLLSLAFVLVVGSRIQRSSQSRYEHIERSTGRCDQSSIRFSTEDWKSSIDVTNHDANSLPIGEQWDHLEQEADTDDNDSNGSSASPSSRSAGFSECWSPRELVSAKFRPTTNFIAQNSPSQWGQHSVFTHEQR